MCGGGEGSREEVVRGKDELTRGPLTNDLVRGIAGKSKSSCFGVNLHRPPQSLLSSVSHTNGKII